MTKQGPAGPDSPGEQPSVAVMQGRLSPPVGGKIQSFPTTTWQLEFARAAAAGLQAIEWIFDATDNPLLTVDGRDRIRALASETQFAFGVALAAHGSRLCPDALERLGVLRQEVERPGERQRRRLGARPQILLHLVRPL